MEVWLVPILVALIGAGSASLTNLVTAWINKKRRKEEKEDSTQQILGKLDEIDGRITDIESRLEGLKKAQKIMMQDRIRHLAEKYIEAGSISFDNFNDLKTMHEIYHNDLHGNGFLNDIMDDVKELPKTK